MSIAEVAGTTYAVPRCRAHLDAVVRGASMVALAVAVLLPASWWLEDLSGGLRSLLSTATGTTEIGRLAGLVASVLLLAQVLLMARIPALERAWGQDRLARMHRVVGFTSFTLMLAHIALISVGYAGGSLVDAPSMLWQLTLSYPGMLLAAAGTLCLVMVVVTSVRAARRRLRYESWHLLHLYAYLGAGLALPHQLWTGEQFLSRPLATVFWWGLWCAAVLAVLVWRIGQPLWRSQRHDLRVTSVVDEGAGHVSVYVAGRDLPRLRTEPGQFFTWRFRSGPGWTRANPYSISAAPDGRSLRITAREVGDGSARLRSLRPGTRVLVEGPYGRLSPRVRTQRKVLLVGAGSGLAPIRSLAEGLQSAPGDVTVIARWGDAPVLGRELEQLADERGHRLLQLTGPRRAADSWLPVGAPAGLGDTEILRAWLPDLTEHDVYLCGPDAWAEAVKHSVLAAGVPVGRVHHESFRW